MSSFMNREGRERRIHGRRERHGQTDMRAGETEAKRKKERGKKGHEGIHKILKSFEGIEYNYKNMRVHNIIFKT